jgi:hypothetical protein
MSRLPSSEEIRILESQYDKRLAHFRSNSASAAELLKVGKSAVNTEVDPKELAAYTVVASVVLNLDEAITKE